MPKKVVFISQPIFPGASTLLKKNGFTIVQSKKKISSQAIVAAANKADALLCLLTDKIGAPEIKKLTRPRIIANYAVGFDNINLPAATAKRIAVTNTPGTLTNTVAEHVIALMFALTRRIVESDKFTRAGKYKGWEPFLLIGDEVAGATMGIIGMGRIGTSVAHKAAALGMNVLYTTKDPVPKGVLDGTKAKQSTLNDVLKKSDIIVVLTPLTPETRHMINANAFRKMKKSAFLINSARGPVVKEADLIHALKTKRIRGAGLDVFEFEPKIPRELTALDNVVLTPHTASASFQARDGMGIIAAQNIIDFFSGKKPRNLLNPEVYNISQK